MIDFAELPFVNYVMPSMGALMIVNMTSVGVT
jgi:hypothetical protein